MATPASPKRRFLALELSQAIARRQLTVAYQPQVNLERGTTVGFEALLRWQHFQLGYVSPGLFISIAEESELIHELGDWILKEAIRQLKQWQTQYQQPFKMAVNISVRQLLDPCFIFRLQHLLVEHQLAAHFLELEITESILIENFQTLHSTLEALRNLGVQLAIDDFGTGYSSLRYLKLFRWDVLKLDRSFVSNLHLDQVNAVITKNMINMSQELGFRVVAEGIEHPEELAQLRQYGCDEVQGYFLCHPLSAGLLESQYFFDQGFRLGPLTHFVA
ncbi:bifunctional diguanylate cyclase/phosphodiesterase [Picosynechococcus sp. NKBG15041c]|uniref:putative bifunctional diguanylate cyclase/phosphodiesterase n=1 Tax=Picosynechococcus sp. NKBG15041c TaxID=1407650 RepID=UPI00046761F7|nr:EAL domain-containing protein [Picosynechococcus sp. NKBG15041c]